MSFIKEIRKLTYTTIQDRRSFIRLFVLAYRVGDSNEKIVAKQCHVSSQMKP